MAGKPKGEAKAASPKASAKAPAREAVSHPDLPELDEEGSIPMTAFVELSPEDLVEVCRRAGKDFGGVAIVGDRAYL